ncbi:hypothetical protein F2Q69_00019650 [Brassica cretica]|uniref:Uncharacterized protein n=1 Tax=Brassica cretica TaxID=69181 RepID=A0A8S9Q547_BRACR|nr:hypothetical protein F2Q69_00019650 [Brassica cretica]
MWELKMKDLAMKEKLSKLAILDTLLAKKEPLSETEEVVKNKLLAEFRNKWNKIIAIPNLLNRRSMVRTQQTVTKAKQKLIFCWTKLRLATIMPSGFSTLRNLRLSLDSRRHAIVVKWWDVAVMEEMRAMDTQYGQLAENVDYLTFLSDYETQLNQVKDLHNDIEQKLVRLKKIVCELAKKKSRYGPHVQVAHDIFYSDHNMKFILEHAWCLLRYEQKWLNLNTPKATGSSKRKTGEAGFQSSSTNVGDHEIMPEGIKAEKARRNNAQGKALSEY